MKKCCRCGIVKDLKNFNKDLKAKDNLRPECAECRKARRSTGRPNADIVAQKSALIMQILELEKQLKALL